MSAIKMDELLVSWLGSDDVYENVMELIKTYRTSMVNEEKKDDSNNSSNNANNNNKTKKKDHASSSSSPRGVIIPPFYPVKVAGRVRRRRQQTVSQKDTWDPLPPDNASNASSSHNNSNNSNNSSNSIHSTSSSNAPPLLPHLNAHSSNHSANSEATPTVETTEPALCVRDQTLAIFQGAGQPMSDNNNGDAPQLYLTSEAFVRITKDVCGFPSFFNIPLYARILFLWNRAHEAAAADNNMDVITFDMMEWFWKQEMEPFDPCDRFFNLVKHVDENAIVRDDFLPFIKALLQDHPGLEFLSTHAEFQEKYAVTVITRIFYSVNKCHSGRITARQVRRSDLLSAFLQVDEEEDINKVTRYFSYEHFYVLYCRFWELDNDRDYRITREDLLKYGDQSLSHMIVDRIFDAAPRPFEQQLQQQQQQQQDDEDDDEPSQQRPSHRDYLSYEDFIYFMLSEEDKSNEVSVRYWFTCVDVDGDGKLNNMEMRSFYAVQLHRMQFMGHEIVPFEDMLCQMMDMIKPAHDDFLVETDFLQPECRQVSGALFDALFNLNKYLLFEQRDPFVERQKREDEFDCDWDRFACLDYSRLAMEEEAREEEAMEIDWVTVDDDEEEDEHDDEDEDELTQDTDDDSESDLQGAMLQGGGTASEAPF